MSADVLPGPPRKTSWKLWVVVVACAAAVITIALLAIPSKPAPIRVWFVGTTNDAGVKKLVFAGTNGLATKVEILLILTPTAE